MPKQNYELKAKGQSEAELLIYGDIGASWWDESITAKQVANDLADMDVDLINVRINSYGGSVSDGIAIYNTLRRHKAAVNVQIDAVAVSIASLIAMAGDTVEMSENALFMVHAPWSGAIGNSKELRDHADLLDKYADAMSSSYMKKTGKSKLEIMGMLTDGEDHWFTAEEAMNYGFVDSINTDAIDIAASYRNTGFAKSKFASSAMNHPSLLQKKVSNEETTKDEIESSTNLAASVAATLKPKKEAFNMPNTNKTTATPEDVANKEKAENEAIDKAAKAAAAKALADDSQRRTEIRNAYQPFVNREGVQDLLNKCLDDHTVTPDAASQKLLNKLGEGAESIGGGSAVVVEDESSKRISAAADVLLVRAGVHMMKGNGVKPVILDLNSNPFRGSTLMDMARASLRSAGKNPDGMDKREIVAQAFQTTSDFPILLENVIHKTLQMAYATAPDTWSRFSKVGSVSDFRAHNRYRVGSIGNLDSLTEHGEFKNKTIPDGEKGSISATTKGNIIAITREAIINDDLQALTDLAQMLGRAYRRTIEAAVYALLAENAGLGPVMNDTKTLFHADHGNIGTGAAISMASVDADRVLMASQKDVGGNDFLDLRPSVLLVPIGLGGTARTINEAVYDPDTANKLQKPNQVNGVYSDIVDTPRLIGTRRYSFADANDAPVIEVAFLDGIQEPYIEAKDGWNVDGAELKVRGDFGVAAIDYRGAVTNAGT